MNTLTFRLVFAFVWLVIGVVLLARHSLGLSHWDDASPNFNLDYSGIVAMLFAMWQFRGYFMHRRRLAQGRATTNALSPRDGTDQPPEYNPEFDFSKPEGK